MCTTSEQPSSSGNGGRCTEVFTGVGEVCGTFLRLNVTGSPTGLTDTSHLPRALPSAVASSARRCKFRRRHVRSLGTPTPCVRRVRMARKRVTMATNWARTTDSGRRVAHHAVNIRATRLMAITQSLVPEGWGRRELEVSDRSRPRSTARRQPRSCGPLNALGGTVAPARPCGLHERFDVRGEVSEAVLA